MSRSAFTHPQLQIGALLLEQLQYADESGVCDELVVLGAVGAGQQVVALGMAFEHDAVILGQLFGHRGDERLADAIGPLAVDERVFQSAPDGSVALQWENLVLLQHRWRDGCACLFVSDDPYLLSRLELLPFLFGGHLHKSMWI